MVPYSQTSQIQHVIHTLLFMFDDMSDRIAALSSSWLRTRKNTSRHAGEVLSQRDVRWQRDKLNPDTISPPFCCLPWRQKLRVYLKKLAPLNQTVRLHIPDYGVIPHSDCCENWQPHMYCVGILAARSPWWLIFFLWWCLVFVGSRMELPACHPPGI
jgi:hypothetical protein